VNQAIYSLVVLDKDSQISLAPDCLGKLFSKGCDCTLY